MAKPINPEIQFFSRQWPVVTSRLQTGTGRSTNCPSQGRRGALLTWCGVGRFSERTENAQEKYYGKSLLTEEEDAEQSTIHNCFGILPMYVTWRISISKLKAAASISRRCSCRVASKLQWNHFVGPSLALTPYLIVFLASQPEPFVCDVSHSERGQDVPWQARFRIYPLACREKSQS